MEELFSAALDVQEDLKQKKTLSSFTGCSILLQILYFENVNMGKLNAPQNIVPRVNAYDSRTLSLLIAADKAYSASKPDNAVWGSSVLRPPMTVSETIHQTFEGSFGQITKEQKLISDFGQYVRNTFGDKVTQEQSSIFSWFWPGRIP